jgi:hypothetical protein
MKADTELEEAGGESDAAAFKEFRKRKGSFMDNRRRQSPAQP